MLTLHNYFRSSTSTRLRAALNLKGLAYDYKAYALLKKETQTPFLDTAARLLISLCHGSHNAPQSGRFCTRMGAHTLAVSSLSRSA